MQIVNESQRKYEQCRPQDGHEHMDGQQRANGRPIMPNGENAQGAEKKCQQDRHATQAGTRAGVNMTLRRGRQYPPALFGKVADLPRQHKRCED